LFITKKTKVMALKFALFENHLTSDPNDYMAVVQDLQSKSQEDVIDLMVGRGSTVTKAEALSVLEEYAAAIFLLLKDGYAINTPIFNLSPSVKGVFSGPDQSFNPASHSVKINITAGARLREVGPKVTVERIKGASPQPDPEYLDDLGSGTRNDLITSGNIAQLRGSRLKFDPEDPAQGVFLIAADASETRMTTVARNKPGQIDFLVPTLAAGDYKLEVRAIILNGKELKKGALPATLRLND
jgi:hypothetical protein